MSKYPIEIKEKALEVLKNEGYDRASQEFGVSKSTLNVWRREAGFSLSHKAIDKAEAPLQLDELVEREIEASSQIFQEEAHDEDNHTHYSTEDEELSEVDLLRTVNGKLRRRNKILREMLIAVLEW